jgi:hypothetical protein
MRRSPSWLVKRLPVTGDLETFERLPRQRRVRSPNIATAPVYLTVPQTPLQAQVG